MKFIQSIVLAFASAQLIQAVAEPQITAAPSNGVSAYASPSLVGWASTSGQSQFGVARTCDYPDQLSRSGSYVQCCNPSSACNFFTSCGANTLLASQTSVVCNDGYCNTGVVVSSIGGSGGQSFLGCWPTEYGTAPFSLYRDIGSASVVVSPGSGGSTSSGSISSTTGSSGVSAAGTSGASAAASTSMSGNTGTTTSSAAASSTSKTGAGMVLSCSLAHVAVIMMVPLAWLW